MISSNVMGDLAQGYQLRNRSAAIKQDIQRYSTELTTGQKTDVRGSLAGNYSFLTDVERRVSVLGSYSIATSEATQFAGAMQRTLDNYSTLTQGLSSTLLTAGTSASGANSLDVASDARATLDSLVNTLNTSFAGRSLFAGDATSTAPLVDSDALLTSLTAAMAGATTPADMITAAEAWFTLPTGFAATAYQGSATALDPFALSPDERVSLSLRADDPGLTRALRAAAVASLANDAGFGLTEEQKTELFALTGEDLLISKDDIVSLQADVGFAEARIEGITARNAAEVTSLNMARNALLEADPFEAATKLEEVQFQLQSLYSITVRTSQLSLVNFL